MLRCVHACENSRCARFGRNGTSPRVLLRTRKSEEIRKSRTVKAGPCFLAVGVREILVSSEMPSRCSKGMSSVIHQAEPQLMVRVNAFVAYCCTASISWTEKLEFTGTVGVPEINPLRESESPGGSVPEMMLHN